MSKTGAGVPWMFPEGTGAAKSQLAGNGSAAAQVWWGGWGSNPRPADYEETGPAAIGAGREPSLSISAGQLGPSRTGRDRPGRGGMGRMF
jgi:hypothetical protein